MLATARKSLGLVGRPNYITRDYARRHGAEFLDAPWCDMSITYWARVSGNAKAVLPDGDRAYTVWHAEDGRDLGRWHPGTAEAIKAHAKPGAVVFFDWDGSNTIGRIDHVGLVERNLGDGRVVTIEGNTEDACKRRVRGSSVVAGFWNPPYKTTTEQEDDVAAKDLWQHELKVPFGSAENPEWQAGNVLVNAAKWIHEMRSRLAEMDAKLDAHNVTIKALADALAERNENLDADALIDRIRTQLDNVSVHLEVGK
jgi:hypothetical protein